jgi:predicted metal-dependent hydrolase/catechol 2,3-dioxygenase-like lactoylglutathione lyase family enzyme
MLVEQPVGDVLPVEVIRSHKRRKTVQAREVDGRLQVLLPSWMSAADEARWVKEMQRRMARRTPATDDAELGRRAAALARRYRLPAPASARWSDRQGRRWGSCTPSTGTIRVSSRLAMAPPWVLDYVVVHELAHLVVPVHDTRFQTLVNRYPRSQRAQGFLDAWGMEPGDDDAAGSIVGIDHVQLAMPAGGEAAAEAFYAGLLGIARVPKPAALAARGGCWFERDGVRVHLGVEQDFRPARKAHPALAVQGLTELAARLAAAGCKARRGDSPGQLYVNDPFGNRIELIDRAESTTADATTAGRASHSPVERGRRGRRTPRRPEAALS